MGDINKLRIKTNYNKKNIVITMPIDLLAWASEQREDGMAHKVSDREVFAKEVARRICNEVDAEEDGSTAFDRLLDQVFEDIFADGIECYDEGFEEMKDTHNS